MQQAVTTGPPRPPFNVDPGAPIMTTQPARRGRPPHPPQPPPPAQPAKEGFGPDFAGFGILKLSNSAPPTVSLPPISTHHSFPAQYQCSPSAYQRLTSDTPTSSTSGSSSPSDISGLAPAADKAASPANNPPTTDWEVLKVVELPQYYRMGKN